MSVLERSRSEGVLTLRMNRPESRNAVDDELREALAGAFADAERADDVRCLVLTGTDGAFCAGGDIEAMRDRREAGFSPVDDYERLSGNSDDLIGPLYRLGIPTIARVNGYAVGMGFALALACDVAIAGEGARFGASFRNVGLGPDNGLSFTLPRLVGQGRALELFYTGELVDADRAASMGLVNRAVPNGRLDDEVDELASTIAEGPTTALVAAKTLVKDNADRDFEGALEAEAAMQSILYTTHDHEEGVAAFREGREPEFVGR